MAPQLWLGTTAGSEDMIELKFSGAFPQFVTCTVCVDDVCAGKLPKLTLNELRHADGAATAMSILEMKL
jgi:hypothetical protein